jgi:hypothetical protein
MLYCIEMRRNICQAAEIWAVGVHFGTLCRNTWPVATNIAYHNRQSQEFMLKQPTA